MHRCTGTFVRRTALGVTGRSTHGTSIPASGWCAVIAAACMQSTSPPNAAAATAPVATSSAGEGDAQPQPHFSHEVAAAEESKTARRVSAMATMERAAAARREIFDLWRTVSGKDGSATAAKETDEHRLTAVNAILETYKIGATTPREEDVCRGLGDALDRLLLLCVPLPATSGAEQLERILQATGRQGRQLSVRTVQHLFARTGSFAEALAVFYALRRCHFAMSMESYHAMLYSLQRLEEEGWALRFHDEVAESNGAVSEQALDFILKGVDNQLLPENKPWLGRIMFADQDNAASERQSKKSFDELGAAWAERYKGGSSIPRV